MLIYEYLTALATTKRHIHKSALPGHKGSQSLDFIFVYQGGIANATLAVSGEVVKKREEGLWWCRKKRGEGRKKNNDKYQRVKPSSFC